MTLVGRASRRDRTRGVVEGDVPRPARACCRSKEFLPTPALVLGTKGTERDTSFPAREYQRWSQWASLLANRAVGRLRQSSQLLTSL
jgi:hypothetical protein